MKTKLLLFALVSILGCSSPTTKTDSATKKSTEETPKLTWEDAQQRAAQIKNVEYELDLSMNETPTFQGRQRITFEALDTAKALRIDFYEGKILKLLVNGQDPILDQKKGTIQIPATALKKGKNEILIDYEAEMGTTGSGLHRFVDPLDGSVFIYSQFEAFAANRFMPCFDQPDLKATLKLKVTAPKKWTIVTTTRETDIQERKTVRVWDFPKTQRISTYIFSLHAGPFKIWEDKFENTKLRLMVRPSLAKFVDPKTWFQLTKQGLKFFNVYFDYPYPFEKYDQLIVPEFNAGAMENVGAVTFSEDFVQRGKITREHKLQLANTLLHEMAHMWFGNLVTMKWWNDLWLNESFASFMATVALENATEFKAEAWRDFFSEMKLWAYFDDQLSSTHSIEAPVKNTDDAFASFDGITYGKGASVLKQVYGWMGPEAFQKGMQAYMKTYAFQNTELKDFIGSLQSTAKQNLSPFMQAWLKQSGLDTVAVGFQCEENTLKKFWFQNNKPPAQFRMQKFDIAFWKIKNGRLQKISKEPVEFKAAKQEWNAKGECPDLMFPNDGDFAYAKMIFDEKSLQTLKTNLSDLQDPLDRMMVWASLWQMVRDQELSLSEYAEIAEKHLPRENDEKTLRMIVGTLSGKGSSSYATVLDYWPSDSNEFFERKKKLIQNLEKTYWRKMWSAKEGSDLQIFWWDGWVHLARSPDALKKLEGSITVGSGIPKGLRLDQDRRWAVIRVLCQTGSESCDKLVEKEKKKDPSDWGNKEVLGAKASQPSIDVKKKYYAQVLNSKELSLHDKVAISKNLFPVDQKSMATYFQGEFFDFLSTRGKTEDEELVSLVAQYLSPVDCTGRSWQTVHDFLVRHNELPSAIHKGMSENLDEDQRCQKIRKKFKGI